MMLCLSSASIQTHFRLNGFVNTKKRYKKYGRKFIWKNFILQRVYSGATRLFLMKKLLFVALLLGSLVLGAQTTMSC
jgi:hypothetical protein